MLVFVDESGDPGMELDAGSSELFVVTAVVFQTEQDAAACDGRIEAICGQLGLPPGVEFRFSKASRKVRESFLRAVAGASFFYLSVVVEKSKLVQDRRPKPEQFYGEVAGLALDTLKPHLAAAYVEIDKTGGLGFGRHLTKHLSSGLRGPDGTKLIKRVKFTNSKNSRRIQLADMVGGAVARSFAQDRQDKELYRNLIKVRELEVVVRP